MHHVHIFKADLPLHAAQVLISIARCTKTMLLCETGVFYTTQVHMTIPNRLFAYP